MSDMKISCLPYLKLWLCRFVISVLVTPDATIECVYLQLYNLYSSNIYYFITLVQINRQTLSLKGGSPPAFVGITWPINVQRYEISFI